MSAKPKLGKNLRGLIVSASVVVAAPFVGLLATVLLLRGAFGATARVDPAEKARVLAEGISEAMNGTAFGLVLSCVALVPTVMFAVRLSRERRGSGAERATDKGG